MSKKRIFSVLLCCLLVAIGLIGCNSNSNSANSSSNSQAQPKVLNVGSDTAFAPFEFQDEKTKEYVGFDMDLIKAIGKQMGYEVKVQGMPFDGLIPGLQAGSINCVISAMTIKPERAEKVNFSQPYYKSGLTMVVRADNNTIKEFKDLDGKKIAVQIGTTGADEARKIKDAKITEFNTAPEAFLALKSSRVDAVVNDKPVNDYYIAQDGGKDAKTVGAPLTSEDYGIATAKKDTELIKKIDAALLELKKNGEYEKIYVKWFGVKPQ